ncbi:hypothetical protein Lupro_09110 [Lutibacter profundi]|uniref:Uncharacterized protein n=1 Tax=Lutibacter profundi TaxID=1622118 RepID=A0A120IEE2_9FLAO|nr:hypothetical protein [Lutibacter profundi]AMC11410.1 hypothetical protein Lupro_09110 [Lutibacter profundi]
MNESDIQNDIKFYPLDINTIDSDALFSNKTAMINGVAVTVPDCTTIYYLPCNGIQNADGHAGTTNCDGSTTILDFSNCGTGYDDDASSYGGGGIGAPNPTDNSSTSGGGTGSTTNTSNNNELIEGAIGIIRYNTTAASALKNNLLLTSNQIAWIGDSKNNTEVTLIFNFLEKNKIGEDYTSEAKNFAKLAVEAYDNGGDVDWVDMIINNLSPKADCVYQKLKSNSTGFKNAIKKFDGEFPVSHLNFIMEDLGNTRAQTQAPDNYINTTSADYIITIALNNNSNIHGVKYRPNLMTAKTIVHEVIHAEMYRKLLSLANQGHLSFTGWTIQQQKDYMISIKNNFPGIYDYYRRYKNWQHQQMATHYRQTIANILKEFDNSLNTDQFYMDLAWEGLDKTSIVGWQDGVSENDKIRILKVISDYININKNENCQ